VTLNLNNNTITRNTASDGYGGGISAGSLYSGHASLTLTNNIITENVANEEYSEAGGISAYSRMSGSSTTLNLTNNIIAENSAYDSAGIYAASCDSSNTRLTLTNNTITGNIATDDGGGITAVCQRCDTPSTTVLNLINEIIWGNTAGDDGDDLYLGYVWPGSTTTVNVTYSDIGNIYNNNAIYNDDGTNINDNPWFRNPGAGDYHLTEDSSCIDKGKLEGAPTTDFEGDPRPYGDGVDIGADEYVLRGDFDGDGDVDGTDLAVFAADFGRTDCCESGVPRCEGDFDGDCDVDGSDLAKFAANSGRTDCPPCP